MKAELFSYMRSICFLHMQNAVLGEAIDMDSVKYTEREFLRDGMLHSLEVHGSLKTVSGKKASYVVANVFQIRNKAASHNTGRSRRWKNSQDTND